MSQDSWICNAAWNSITFYPNGKISPCCLYNYADRKDLTDFCGTSTFANIQKEMLAGQVPPGCSQCKTREDKGQQSYRTSFGTDPKYRNAIRYIDLRNSNFCNLACRSCGPEQSSTWAKLLGEGFITNTSVFEYIDPLLTNDLQDLYVTGGEPFLNPDHWTVLDKLVELDLAKNIHLRYNTNLTTLSYKDKNVLDYWPKFKKVSVALSVDAVGTPVESIRSGTNWSTVEKNINQLQNLQKHYPTIDLRVFCTISSLNVWFLNELVKYFNGKEIPCEFFELTVPSELALVHLPAEYRHQAINVLKQLPIDSPEIKVIIDSLAIDNDNYYKQMIEHIKKFDSLNSENLLALLPFTKSSH